jgi:hypothetical protein
MQPRPTVCAVADGVQLANDDRLFNIPELNYCKLLLQRVAQACDRHRPRSHPVAGSHGRRNSRCMSAGHALRSHTDGARRLARCRQTAAGHEQPIDLFRNERTVGDIVITPVTDKEMLSHVSLR